MAEDRKERINRELIELLQELRVALPGVQVLFAFLLTVPFTVRFQQVNPFQRNIYFATLLLTAVSSILLIAPTSYHRLRFRAQDKERMLFTSNKMTIVGLATLALAMAGVVLLITDVLFSTTAAYVAAGAIVVLFVWLWFAMPLSRRVRDEQVDDQQRQPARTG